MRPTVPSKRSATDAQEAAWVADEDRFVLQQAKKKAALRVVGGRADPIDWLTVALAVIHPEHNDLGDDIDQDSLDVKEPSSVFDRLSATDLGKLEKAIDTYMVLEKSRSNREYWSMMQTICRDRQREEEKSKTAARGIDSVAGDLDKLLGPKTLAELEKLETQIKGKLSSNQPIDTDYWEHLLQSLLTYKARAKLKNVTRLILGSRLQNLRRAQVAEATSISDKLVSSTETANSTVEGDTSSRTVEDLTRDPDPSLKLEQRDKALSVIAISDFQRDLMQSRLQVSSSVYVPNRKRGADALERGNGESGSKRQRTDANPVHSNSTAFDREVARGLGDNEEIFTQEVEVITKNRAQWDQQYRPRKPKYFARVQLGYEWNKYNQTHYDQDNPPPRVVQGYKFNVFYPDLVDQYKAPTFKIERDDGRRRGQTLAPAGEQDSCVIRFVSGPPYEDLAFRIVDKEWDYSARRERGFRSNFDKGILQLHFQFKKVYYRK